MRQVRACPECDSTDTIKRGKGLQDHGTEYPYACNACGFKFTGPVWRESRSTGPGTKGLAKVLDDMDPDGLDDALSG